MEITELTVHELKDKLASGELTSYDITKAYADRIKEKEKNVQAFVTELTDSALEKGKEIDEKRSKKETKSELAGIPVGIKDNICTKGIRTTCSSRMLENFIAPYNATVMEKINAEELIKSFTPEQMREYKENYKLTNDPRITKVGKFLRKTSLDELPQLINIINGDLSIIGPRPLVADELEKYGVNKDKFLSVTPGLTGYWAANGRSNTTYEQRMEMELYYIDNLSLKMDIKVFFKTILSVLKKEGAI